MNTSNFVHAFQQVLEYARPYCQIAKSNAPQDPCCWQLCFRKNQKALNQPTRSRCVIDTPIEKAFPSGRPKTESVRSEGRVCFAAIRNDAEEGESNAAASLAASAASAGHGLRLLGRLESGLQEGVALALAHARPVLLLLGGRRADRVVVVAVGGREGARQRRDDGEVGGGEAEVPRQDQPRQEGTSG